MNYFRLSGGDLGEVSSPQHGILGRSGRHGVVLSEDDLRTHLRQHPHGNFTAVAVGDDGKPGEAVDLSQFAPQPTSTELVPVENSADGNQENSGETGDASGERQDNSGERQGNNAGNNTAPMRNRGAAGGANAGQHHDSATTIHEHVTTDRTLTDDGQGNRSTDEHSEAQQQQQ